MANDKLQTGLAVQTAKELKYSENYLQLVKNTFAKGATDNELSLFFANREPHRS
jgi:hypothetical protein